MEYVYIFKNEAIKKLKNDCKEVNDKLSYDDINKMTNKYDLFIRKLLFLIYDDKEFRYDEIKKYLFSNNILDRLKGLKECKYYIKIVSDD